MVARSAGSFLGGFFNNPGLVAIALGIGALLVFRKPITEAFANFKLPSINLPDINFGDFKFPTFEAPSFDFGNIFGGNGDSIRTGMASTEFLAEEAIPNPLQCKCGTTIIQDATGAISQTCDQCPTEGSIGPIAPLDPDRPTSIDQFAALADPIRSIVENFNVQTDIEGQTFTGGGLSFIGGSVTEIPLERLSLSQIIDRLGVTASQASSLRAEAIGFTTEEQAFLNIGQELSPLGDLGAQTSGGFEGLTPEEIALRLTGGNISNF